MTSDSRFRVLLVDDDHQLLATTSALLSDDFDVTTADGGARALEILDSQQFDVLCVDYSMPGMDGEEVMARALDRCGNNLRGILLTGMREYFNEDHTGKSYSFAVVLKPYDPDDLTRVIHQQGTLARMRQAVNRAKTASSSGGKGGG